MTRVAVREEGRAVSFGDLDGLVAQHARDLSRQGLSDGAVLCLVADRAVDVAVAVLAAAEVDAALLLLDGSAPEGERARVRRQQRIDAMLAADGDGLEIHRLAGAPGNGAMPGGLLLRTSGATGEPQIAARSWPAVMRSASAVGTALALEPDDVVVSTSPLHHSYAVNAALLPALLAGATFNRPPVPATPERVASAIEAGGGSVVMSVPALWRWYASADVAQLRPRLAISAGESLPRDVYEAWLRSHEHPLCENYGTTETGPLTVDPEGVPGSVGHALPGIAIEVAGADGDQPGRVLVRELDGDPYDTGDLGRLARDGRLCLEGRASERVKVGGTTIALREIETVIEEQPEVRACACAVPDARLWAFLELEAPVDQVAFRRRLLQELAPHKVPSVLRPVDGLPRTSSGKIARGALAQLASAATPAGTA